jgi:lysozyme
MEISDNGMALVMAFEGCHKAVPGRPGYFRAYVDPVGVLTIGWGHTNHHYPKFDKNAVWSQAECDRVKRMDMEIFERHVAKHTKVPLRQCEFDALVSWSFNTGGPASATVWKRLNSGDKAGVPAALAAWNKGTVNGKKVVLNGLTRRRKAEGELFAGDITGALRTAGAKKPVTPKVIPPPPPDVEPVPAPRPAPPRSFWADLLAAIFSVFRRKK